MKDINTNNIEFDFDEILSEYSNGRKLTGKDGWGREQFAYIGKKIIKKEYNYFKNIALLKDDDLIMVTKKGKQLTRKNAFVIVNRLYKEADIFKQGLHLLRHTFAMSLPKKVRIFGYQKGYEAFKY